MNSLVGHGFRRVLHRVAKISEKYQVNPVGNSVMHVVSRSMSRRYPIFAWNEGPENAQPILRVGVRLVEIGLKNGTYEDITDVNRPSEKKFRQTPPPQLTKSAGLESQWDRCTQDRSVRSSGTCQICGFTRSVEKAHVIPARFGGQAIPENLLNLCPNHHTLFDRTLLTWEEIEIIWPVVFDALVMTASDPRLDEWRTQLTERYGVSFKSS